MGCDFEGPVWEWWDFEDSEDWWVSKLDMILCFDGSMGFQLGDWCWFCEKEDSDLLILVGVCWVQIYGYADLFLCSILVGVCWFWVLNFGWFMLIYGFGLVYVIIVWSKFWILMYSVIKKKY